MMNTYKLRIKIGSNEFEAEGDKESVMAQFDIFKELVSRDFPQVTPPINEISDPTIQNGTANKTSTENALEFLFNNDVKRHIISLKVMPAKGKRHIMDAVLLTLLGYKLIRNEEQILGTQIKASLRQSGIIQDRIDRKIEGDIKEGLILKSGLKKGSKYMLTNKGVAEAEYLMNSILKQIT